MNRTTLAGVVVMSPSDPVLEPLQLDRLRVPWVVEAEPMLRSGDDRALEHPFATVVTHLPDLGHQRFFHIADPCRRWPSATVRRPTAR